MKKCPVGPRSALGVYIKIQKDQSGTERKEAMEKYKTLTDDEKAKIHQEIDYKNNVQLVRLVP